MSDIDQDLQLQDSPLEKRINELEMLNIKNKYDVENQLKKNQENSSKLRTNSQKHTDAIADDLLGVQIGSALRVKSKEMKVIHQTQQQPSQFVQRMSSSVFDNRKQSLISVSRDSSRGSSQSMVPKGILKKRDSLQSSNSRSSSHNSSSNSTEKKVQFKMEQMRNNLLQLK